MMPVQLISVWVGAIKSASQFMRKGIQHLSNVVKVALLGVAFFALSVTSLVQAKDSTGSKVVAHPYEYFWLKKTQKEALKRLFEPTYLPIRFKYSKVEHGHDWLIKEYGKEQLIDYKVRVKHNAIASIQVMEYRESYGGEIKQSRFRDQFVGATLRPVKQSYALSKRIDGISGATISVNSTKRIAAMALFLENELAQQPEK
ncbi:MAG: FMN-binding protein [Pseudomonadota bacterium]